MKLRNVSIFKPKRRREAHHPWLVAYGTGDNRGVAVGSTDYADTVEFAKRLSALSQRVDLGLADRAELRQEVQRRRRLTDHLNEYQRHLIACGKTKKHALQMRLYAEEVTEDAKTVDEIVPSSIQRRIGGVDSGPAAKNRRAYAVLNFLRWGAGDNRWPRSIPEGLRLASLPKSRRMQRRVLPMDQIARLVTTARNGVAVAGMGGYERSLLYRTMLASGLRLGEASRLLVGHLLGCYLDVPATLTKNRKHARLPIPPALAAELAEYHQISSLGRKLFDVPNNPHRLLTHDLKAAGIPRTTAEGTFDFHSFRHQCATNLASSGAPVRSIQTHMRHGSVQLTLDTYGHLMDRDRKKVVEVLKRHDKRAGELMYAKPEENQWSHGESNPDLLNAIQKQDSIIRIQGIELRDKRNKRIAPERAQRLLRRMFSRLATKRRGGSR